MVVVSLLEFARSGAFGPVRLGLGRDHVQALLGEPEDRSRPFRKRHDTWIWKYGTTEFHFKGGPLALIYSDDFEVPDGGATLRLDPWVVRRGLPVPRLQAALTEAGVGHVQAPYAHEPGAILLRTAAGVRFLFAEGDGTDAPGLSAFSLEADRSAEP